MRGTFSKPVHQKTKKAISMGEFNEHSFKAPLEITGLIKALTFYQLLETGATANPTAFAEAEA